jgi:hypothetical protein
MRHLYLRAMAAKQSGLKPEIVGAAFRATVAIAEKIAPYGHPRLSAVKLAGDPNNPAHFKDDAAAEELRAEIQRRLNTLLDTLTALSSTSR